MRIHKPMSVALLLASTVFGTGASAQVFHVVGESEMQAAIATRVSDQASQRAAIQSLLARPEVRQLASNAGLDLEGAKVAAANLDGDELQRLSTQATAAEAQLVGGNSTVVLSTTALLIILLIVILLVA